MPDIHVDEVVDLYVLDALEPSEQLLVATHIETCAQCQELVRERQRIVELLAWTPEQRDPPAALQARLMQRITQGEVPTEPVEPSPELHDRVMRRIQHIPQVTPKAWWQSLVTPRMRLAASALALVLVLVLGGTAIRLQQSLAETRNQAAQQQRVLSLLQTPQARLVSLAPTDQPVAGTVQLLLSPATNQAYLLTNALGTLPADKTYQLWLIKKDQPPVGAGVFAVDPKGMATLNVEIPEQISNYQVAAITIEPAGGSVRATTAPILAAEF